MSETTLTKPVVFRNDSLNIALSGMLHEGKPVFFAVEVAKALGYEKPHQALEYNCKSLIKVNFLQCKELGLGDRPKGIILLTEPDLYRLILRSKLPSAEKVQDWVCEEVLPSIRQTGGYQLPVNSPVPQSFAEALRLAADLADQNLQLTDERDHAVRTKAHIDSRRAATACQRNSTYQRIANRAIRERDEMAARFGASKEWASTAAVWRATGIWYGYRRLMRWCDDNDLFDTYCYDPNTDDRALCYPHQAWIDVYGVDIDKLF
ncbi:MULTISPECIES: BRO family protein [unclassified Serratia (in: enterobacteria)]|uniref:BRO-N domain-containing protein n=1 Tax=unclassified Serratia (in: enterobacteria) TaxID=2647522 RepID=UPI00046AEFC4|nr:MULTISPECIES: BRO family protein [unclassified Serratia (in: enterobacteria)]